MSYEIDYLPVGEGEKSGDAICVRYGNFAGPRNEQTVIVIDGGDKKAGEGVVSHIKTHYGTEYVDYVVLTHPDADHASGLTEVLENLNVGLLLMHRPWEHAADIKDSFRDGRWTERGLSSKIENSLKHANEIEDVATRKGIKIVEPFQGVGTSDESILFLGPSKEFYQEMLINFRSTPTPKTESSLMSSIFAKASDVIRYIEDRLDIDLMNDDVDSTSAENNTSAILLLTIDTKKFLFTGDAGKTGLLAALEYAEGKGISLDDLQFFDVPHHGSRRNINTKIIKRMKGLTSFISASGENKKHPSKRVTNSLKKHGSMVFVNRKQTITHYQGSTRSFSQIEEEPFHNRVEE